MRRAFALAATALLAAGCQPASAPGAATPPAPASSAAAVASSVAAPAAAVVPAPAPTHLRGKGVMGKDGFGLVLCGEDTQRIAVLEPAAQGLLDGFLGNGAHEFQFDGWGDLVGMDKVHVTALDRVYGEGPGCDEKDGGFAFRAHGTEPFWGLDVGSQELVLSRPEHPALAAPAKELAETHGIRSFEAMTPEGRLTARFSRGNCNDGMADAMFGWRAEVTLGAQAFTGCAYGGSSLR